MSRGWHLENLVCQSETIPSLIILLRSRSQTSYTDYSWSLSLGASSPSCLVCKKNNHTDLVRVKENISAHTRANVYIHTHAYTPVYLYTPKHMSASTCIHLAQNRWSIKGSGIKKQRHYFVNKGPSSQDDGFSSSHVWMWELDYKKAECQRIDAFELWWCWRRLLRVPWTARRSN